MEGGPRSRTIWVILLPCGTSDFCAKRFWAVLLFSCFKAWKYSIGGGGDGGGSRNRNVTQGHDKVGASTGLQTTPGSKKELKFKSLMKTKTNSPCLPPSGIDPTPPD